LTAFFGGIMAKVFKTSMFGYDKKEVDEYVKEKDEAFEALVTDSKEKIKQAQAVAMNANKALDELKAEFDKLKAELDRIKTQK